MQTHNVKDAARRWIEDLPDDTTWRDLAYRVALRASIEQGLDEADAGLLTPQDEVEREFDAQP
jgi:predicted transcriptional regulator